MPQTKNLEECYNKLLLAIRLGYTELGCIQRSSYFSVEALTIVVQCYLRRKLSSNSSVDVCLCAELVLDPA
jgi:hypothetical protein